MEQLFPLGFMAQAHEHEPWIGNSIVFLLGKLFIGLSLLTNINII